MKRVRLALMLLASLALTATDISSYTIRLMAAPDGSGQATATVLLSGAKAGTLTLPLGFAPVEKLQLESPLPGLKLEGIPRNGMTQLAFTLPADLPPKTTVSFSFRLKQVFQVVKLKPGEKSSLPASSRTFKHAFVNTQEAPIGTYRVEFLFPEGLMAQAIREQLPKPAKNEVGPRVLLGKVDGRQAATLQLDNLQQGDDTSMAVELVPTRRSLGWLIAGLLLAGLYLYRFQDLVVTKKS